MKAIVFFDLETTGVDLAKDRICQFAALKVIPSTDTFPFAPGNYSTEELKFYINPGISIPLESTEVHGITNEMVKDSPTFNVVAAKIKDFIEGCDLSGFNIKRFDIPLLAEEFGRAGFRFSLEGRNVIDPFILYKILYPQSLSAAYKRYTGVELDGAHDAMNDVVASLRVLQGMINNNEIPSHVEEIMDFQSNGQEFDPTCDFAGKFIRNKDGVIILNFGKHKGEPAEEHTDFVGWMIGKDFTSDTLLWAQGILDAERAKYLRK